MIRRPLRRWPKSARASCRPIGGQRAIENDTPSLTSYAGPPAISLGNIAPMQDRGRSTKPKPICANSLGIGYASSSNPPHPVNEPLVKSFYLFAIVGFVATFAEADVIVDQEHVVPGGGVGHIIDYVGDYDAQTFTANNTGQLTSVGLQLSFKWEKFPKPVTDDLHFKLTRTNPAGDPVLEDFLATYVINPSFLTTDYHGVPMVELDLRDQRVQVHAGDVLALTLTTDYTYRTNPENQYYVWARSISDQIAGGLFCAYSPMNFGPTWFYQWWLPDSNVTWDAGFRITIDTIPEPPALELGALAVIALIALPHRGPRTRLRAG